MKRTDMSLSVEGLNKWHDGNMYFQYGYATVDIASQIKSMDTFEEFEAFFTDELMDGNILLQEYLSQCESRQSFSSNRILS